jgi:hypothetical protein
VGRPGTFGPGNNANPRGRPKKGETLTDTLKAYVNKRINRQQLVLKLYEMALAGNIRAMELIFERVDGKVTQPITMDYVKREFERLASERGLDAAEALAEAERLVSGR